MYNIPNFPIIEHNRATTNIPVYKTLKKIAKNLKKIAKNFFIKTPKLCKAISIVWFAINSINAPNNESSK